MNGTLKWLERTLLAVGIVLGIWCAAVLIQAHHYAHLPIPAPPSHATAPLPGDVGTTAPKTIRHVPTGSWVARLDAPAVHFSATVLEGTDDATLAKAAGHIEDTPFPGQPGNVGIAGHRDTTFRAVRNLKLGDVLTLTTSGAVLHYRITWMKVVEPDDVYVLDPTRKPALTLVTCYPFQFIGHAPHRYIVRAELVGESPRTTE